MTAATDALLKAAKAAVPRLCGGCFLEVPFLSTYTHQEPTGGKLSCLASDLRTAITQVEDEKGPEGP